VKHLPFVLCAAMGLCMSSLRADMHGSSSVDAAMAQWHDAKIRGKLKSVGVIGGHYRATATGEQVLVESELAFRDGGKIRYRQHHQMSRGFPTVIDLVKAYLKLRHGKNRHPL